jgi:hypothetical protein
MQGEKVKRKKLRRWEVETMGFESWKALELLSS